MNDTRDSADECPLPLQLLGMEIPLFLFQSILHLIVFRELEENKMMKVISTSSKPNLERRT